MGMILDSSVVIRAERQNYTVERLLTELTVRFGDQEVALSSIALTEFVHGIYRAQTLEVRSRREEFMKELLDDLAVYPYTRETALLAGRMDGEQAANGVIVPFADLLIGSTALSLGFSVLTTNMRHFQMIPGLKVIAY